MTNQRIGSFICQIRKERGLTQEQLAEKLGVTNRSVSRWENGKTLPDLSVMITLCAVLDIQLSELLAGQRQSESPRIDTCISTIVDLIQREKQHKAKQLNLYFITGSLLLLAAALQGQLGILSVFTGQAYGLPLFWLLLTLGTGFSAAGVFLNSRLHPVSRDALRVITTDEQLLRMKTPEEMIQFCNIHHQPMNKQQRLAFGEIAKQLSSEEFVLYAFTASSCTMDGNPGPWHISAAVSNRRILLSGESIRGRMMTRFVTGSYLRGSLKGVSFQGQQLILRFEDTSIKIDGSHLAPVAKKLTQL